MRTRQWIQAAILLLLGIYLIETLITGEIAYYINEQFNWLALVGGLIFLALGIAWVAYLLREPVHTHDHHDHEPHAPHDHDHHEHGQMTSWIVIGILALPIILGFFLPSKPLGASAIGNSGITTSLSVAPAALEAKTFEVAPEDRNVLDWVRAFSLSGNADEFIGQPADVIGFVYRDIRFDETTQFMVSRFTISCCVADAVAIGLIVESPEAASLAQDSWVRVKGRFQVREFEQQRTPILIAEVVEPTQMPERPYLFP